MGIVFVAGETEYGQRGQRIGPLSMPDGYYFCSNGRYTRLPVLIQSGLAIDNYPVLVHQNDNTRSYGRLPEADPGDQIVVLDAEGATYHRYELYSHGPYQEVLSQLAAWWTAFPESNGWRDNSQDLIDRYHPICRNLIRYMTRGVSIPTGLNQLIGERCAQELNRLRELLDRHLAPIGGRITEIQPNWSSCTALAWIRFEINGVEPTRGIGCLVYKNADFYYGPWCQRSRVGGEIQMYQLPPRYDLRGWITGPLYAAAITGGIGDRSGPPNFQPTGVKLIAAGVQRGNTDPDYDPIDQNQLVQSIAVEAEVIVRRLKRNAINQVVTRLESLGADWVVPEPGPKQIIVRIAPNFSVRTYDGHKWFAVVTRRSDNGPFTTTFPVDYSGLWGMPGSSHVSEKYVPAKECSCYICEHNRKFVIKNVIFPAPERY